MKSLSKCREIAAKIIKLIDLRIRELYPDINLIASKNESKTLLHHGGDYYNIEAEVTSILLKLLEGTEKNY